MTGLTPTLRGELSNAILTNEQAIAAYRRAWTGEDQASIGADYGVTRETVHGIKQGWAWSHITGHPTRRPTLLSHL